MSKKEASELVAELHKLQAKRNVLTNRIAVIKRQLGIQTNNELTTYT